MSKFDETMINHDWLSRYPSDIKRCAVELADYVIGLKEQGDALPYRTAARAIRNRPALAMWLGKYLEDDDFKHIENELLKQQNP